MSVYRGTILKSKFFDRSTEQAARDLLGKFLIRKIGGRKIAAQIKEVEVYDGFRDKGSHASRGRTMRNHPMFGSPGCWYVYFTYGMHWMLNIVTREPDYPAAILIRGVAIESDMKREKSIINLNGPAKLTKFLQIDARLNDMPASMKTGLWIEDRGLKINPEEVCKGPRIGINYAGPYWAKRHFRFWIK